MFFRKRIICLCLMAMILISGCGIGQNNETILDTDAENTNMEGTDKSTETNTQQVPVMAEAELFAMDTYMYLVAYGENAQAAVDEAEAEIHRLDELLSTGNEESEIGSLNQSGSGTVSEDTAYLLERALQIYQMTDGIFDITIYPVMEAWGFTTQDYQVPSADLLNKSLSLTDSSKIIYDKEQKKVSFETEGMKIDLGGIAKGYASARIMEIYKEYGIQSGMVNLGGNVQVLGAKTDGSGWRVAVQNPVSDSEGGYLGIVTIQDKAVITSGGYERYFEQDGKKYHHIIDPSTGYPAENGLISVTIVSEDGTLADALSTSLFIMGKEKAIDFWKEYGDTFDMILETDDECIYITEGIATNFTSESSVEIINR